MDSSIPGEASESLPLEPQMCHGDSRTEGPNEARRPTQGLLGGSFLRRVVGHRALPGEDPPGEERGRSVGLRGPPRVIQRAQLALRPGAHREGRPAGPRPPQPLPGAPGHGHHRDEGLGLPGHLHRQWTAAGGWGLLTADGAPGSPDVRAHHWAV
jgi:hypothetical protein